MSKQTFYKPHSKKDVEALMKRGLTPSRLDDMVFCNFTPALIKELADKFKVQERTIKKYIGDNKRGGPLSCAVALEIIQRYTNLPLEKIVDCE